MKRLIKSLIVPGICLGSVSAHADIAASPAQPWTEATNTFAMDLYGKLREQPGNLLFSPYSVSSAVGMVFVGSRHGTADEIAKMLHLDGLGEGLDVEHLKARFLRQAPHLPAGPGSRDYQFYAANGIWGAIGHKFKPDYIDGLERRFGAEFHPVNFGDEPVTLDRINGWVAQHTNNKIQHLIPDGLLSAETSLVETNAVYFKANWDKPFDAAATDQAVFHSVGNRDLTVDMMNMTDSFSFVATGGLKLLRVPYAAGRAEMIILLPDSKDGLTAVEAGLNKDKLDEWLRVSQPTLVALSLPKFTATDNFLLGDVLEALGMREAFSPSNADLSGIADISRRRLFISNVIHRAFIDVGESGTEAAAASATVMLEATAKQSLAISVQPVPFIADHPFIFLIRDCETGEILFMGRVNDPKEP